MNKQAFTLIEALISVAIMGIGFSGVYGLVSTSNQILSDSIDREKLNFQTSEIMESLHADRINLLTYNNQDLSNCTSLSTSTDKEDQLIRLKNWCEKLEGEVSTKRTQDKRLIRVEKTSDNNFYVVSIDLAGKNDKKTTYIKRVFNAQ